MPHNTPTSPEHLFRHGSTIPLITVWAFIHGQGSYAEFLAAWREIEYCNLALSIRGAVDALRRSAPIQDQTRRQKELWDHFLILKHHMAKKLDVIDRTFEARLSARKKACAMVEQFKKEMSIPDEMIPDGLRKGIEHVLYDCGKQAKE